MSKRNASAKRLGSGLFLQLARQVLPVRYQSTRQIVPMRR